MAPELLALVQPPDWLARLLPRALLDARLLGVEAWQWAGLLLAAAGGILGSILVAGLVLLLMAKLARGTAGTWDDRLVQALRGPTRLLVGLFTFDVLIGPLELSEGPELATQRLVHIALVLAFAWLVFRFVELGGDLLLSRSVGENDVRARGLRTQVTVLKRVVQVLVVVFACALALLQFEVVRSVGVSLLASAGVAGIVLGLAAQKTLGSVIAGIQLSFTQPIRLGDLVVVEGESGTIEDIRLTYVVLKVWDGRRLVVPISRFLEDTFQNWTRMTPEMLGAVELFADYTVPVERVREELKRLSASHKLWDKRVCSLQVTDVSERTLKMRALVSAASSGDLFDLRCDVREQLVRFLRELDGGRYLPLTRVESGASTTGATRSAVA